MRIGCVAARFNSFITEKLLAGALEAIEQHGGDPAEVTVARVPGSLELATVARQLADSGSYDAIICLGAVIKGETDHYEHVSSGSVAAIAAIGPTTGVPTIFGVLTCRTVFEAEDRAGGVHGNSGFEAAVAAIEMASLLRKLRADG